MVKLRGKETLKYSPYEGESEAQQGGEDSHQVQVDEGPPWLEHLDQHLALAGQRVQQDLLLQLILNIETSQTFSLSLSWSKLTWFIFALAKVIFLVRI